jgi:hypothetical protein
MLHFKISYTLRKVVMFLPILITCSKKLLSQSIFDASEVLNLPKAYITRYTKQPPVIDGKIDDACWQNAVWTDKFVDIEGDKKPKPAFDTRVKMLWNDTCLYIAATLCDPHVWATLTRHDAVVFHDNDFEVFIDPGNGTHGYFEVEVNALNTIFDLFLNKPYRNGGKAVHGYDVKGLQSAVHVNGTINDAADYDSGWSVEMAIPFKALATGNAEKQPKEGTNWRINFSRVQWDSYVKNAIYYKKVASNGKPLNEHNWVWSPQGVVNMHWPERWGYLHFTKRAEDLVSVFEPTYKIYQEQYLWLLYYKQQAFKKQHHHYATSLKELGLDSESVMIIQELNQVKLEVAGTSYKITINNGKNSTTIDEAGFVQ